MKFFPMATCFVATFYSSYSFSAGTLGEVEQMIVTADGVQTVLASKTESASVGTVLPHQIAHRPISRPAEILETIPGMVITQHSGGGKANQYFLRGFNLDHSTDFASYFEGAPVNMVSHGHGQGYSDLNFLVPELMSRMVYKKGPYYASEGDFSSAGSARVYYVREKKSQQIKLTGGEYGYKRALFHGGTHIGGSHLVYALSHTQDDGPWETPDKLKRDNAYLKYTRGNTENGFSISGLYFDSSWAGTDQIPKRLVDNGTLTRFGSLDDTTGGETHRYQLSYEQWAELSESSRIKANAYWVDYALSLNSNFTYYSADIPAISPIPGVPASDISDQITQFDERQLLGGKLVWEYNLNDSHELNLGADLRHDDIADVGVGSSHKRILYSLSSHAAISETAYAMFGSVHSQWLNWFSSTAGLRYDHMAVDVTDKLESQHSKAGDADLLSPKLSLRFGPFSQTAIFINYGQGFHSNDARGVVAGDVPLMSQSEGYELGLHSEEINNLQLSLVFFALDLDSELVFVGDDGTTEPNDATRRTGVELSAYYQPLPWLVIDADYTKSNAHYTKSQYDGDELLGDHVPDSIEDVFSLGLSLENDNGLHAGLRLRYFGPRYLTELGDIKSSSSQMINANIGYRLVSGLSFGIEVLNLTDRQDDDITYWYASRTKAERDNAVAPIEDYHSHPMIPRTVRATIAYEF